MYTAHEEDYKGFRIKIILDEDALSPRGWWDNLGTMACWHRCYNLGDEQHTEDINTWLEGLISTYEPGREDLDGDLEEAELWRIAEKHYIFLTLYLYDHSGISISCRSFVGRAQHAEWDSGRVGYIYVSREKIKKEFGAKNWTKKLEEKAIRVLENEVKVYDQYLTGDVYGFQIFKLDPGNEYDDDGEEVESCWGFFGMESCLEEAKSQADYYADQEEKAEAKAEGIAPYLF